MKILFIVPFVNMYGATISTYNLLKVLKTAYNITPIVIVPEEGDITEILDKDKIQYYVIPFRRSFIPTNHKHRLRLFRKYAMVNIKFLRDLKKYRIIMKDIDVIHSSTSVVDIGYYISKLYHIPHVWHIREVGEDYNLTYLLPKSIVAKMYKKTEAIIAISDYVSQMIKKRFKITMNMIIVYNGVNCATNSLEIIKKYDESNQKIRFCIVGIVHPNKNQLDVVKASCILREQLGEVFELTIVGSGQLDVIRTFIDENNLQNVVHLVGYKNDVYSILETMDVGIMASSFEGFGRVTIEYMMHGMSVIASRAGANTELVRDYENGLLYELHNIDELMKCMKYYIENKDKLIEMSQVAYDYAMNNFTTEMNADKIYEIYQKVSE